MSRRPGRLLQRLVLRTGGGPLRGLWALAHRTVIWTVASWITARSNGSSAYLKGGFGFGEPVYGLSDVDMIVVAQADCARSGAERGTLERRWQQLVRRFPILRELFQLWLYEDADLRKLDWATYLTHDLRDSSAERVAPPRSSAAARRMTRWHCSIIRGCLGRGATGACAVRAGNPRRQSTNPRHA